MAKKKPTQEEIIQEVGEVSSNWDKWDKPAMQDPIVWREDYKTEDIINGWDPKLIKNWSMNKDAYGDDGNWVNNVDIPEMYWGKNDKYMWEWTRNTFEAYNPNLTTAWLDPNYKYWVDARMANSAEANYIARRNDNIASALYNEWRTSMQDVADFLNQQEWFRNSTEWERENTIASIWKRIGEKWQGWEKEETKKEESDLSKADNIISDTSWKLYWKTTADSGKPVKWIDTLSDANSVFTAMEEDRAKKLKEFVSLDPKIVATAQLSNSGAFWEQTLRDAEQYYPEFMAQVNAEKKRMIAQENATAIASWWEIKTSADKVDTNTELTSYAVNNATSTTSATQLLQSIDSILESNDTAKSAQELMWSIEKDMATLKNRLKNLRAEANATFKWDVPDYLVNAYMNNKSQEIQNQLSILEDRYNAAYNRYKAELGNAQWEKEYQLKQEELQLKRDSFELDKAKAENGVTWTTAETTQNNVSKTRAERNNNPTAMTTDMAKMLWWVLWQDYEIWDEFIWWDGKTYYTAKLIWDPIETTIRLIDRWIANWIDPFYRKNWQPRWSYIWTLWLSKSIWNKLNNEQKRTMVYKMLKHEWGNMDNMAYYVENANKSQNQYSDADYSNFEKFLDPETNQTTVKAIAAKYWFEDNIAWMTIFANNALNNRTSNYNPAVNMWWWTTNSEGRTVVTKDWKTVTYAPWVTENDSRIWQPWFDPVLGYNTSRIAHYKEILEDSKKWNDASEQDKQEALLFDQARKWGKDVFDYEWRMNEDDKRAWFLLDAKPIYQEIILKKGDMWNKWSSILEALKLNPWDTNAKSTALKEAQAWQEWQQAMESDAMTNNILVWLEYIMMQDAGTIQRNMIMSTPEEERTNDINLVISPEARSRRSYYNTIIQTLALTNLVDLRSQWAAFGNLSNAEWERIEKAASNIDYKKDNDSFKSAIEDVYIAMRDAIWQPISKEEVHKMWNAESSRDFTNYIKLDHSNTTFPFFWWQIERGAKKWKSPSTYINYEPLDLWWNNSGSYEYNFGWWDTTDYSKWASVFQNQMSNK